MVKPTPEQLQKLKALEIEMLASFVEICNKLSLRYYLMGGTLLGAVRHQGFIPWDDDIDVAMPREDYDIFLREGQKQLPEHLFLQHYTTDPAYLHNFIKIRNCRTTFVEYAVHKRPMNHGVFIDVFPLDYYPDALPAQKAVDVAQRMFRFRYRAEIVLLESARHGALVEMGLAAASGLMRLCYPKMNRASAAQEKLHRSIKPAKKWANYCGAWGKKEIMPVEWYGEGTILSFEGLEVMGPKHYDKWLTQVYGDYMQLPPVEKRVGHHYTEAIDLEVPYTEYNKNLF